MKDLAKRGLVGLLTVSMCLSNVQGIAFADNRVEVGGVKVDGKKVTLNLNGGSLMEAARAALAEANVYDDTYIAVSKDAKTQAAYRALTDGSNPLYELALFSDGELQALEDAGVEIVALIQMDQKQAEAAGNLMPATASEIERSSTKVEFFDPSKDEGKEILLYQPDSLFAGFYDQFSNQLMNASEKEIVSADPSTYELSGDEKVTFLFINHADAGRTFNLELNGESLEKGIKVAKAESVIKGVMSTLDVSGIDETLETPAPETSAAVETGTAVTEPSSEAAAQPSTETAIEPSTEASGTAGESIVILPETGATAENGETETSAAAETSAVATQPSQDEANAETGLPAEGQTSTENTEQSATEKTTAPAENTGIVDTIKEVIETIAENANATMMRIERRLGVIRAEAAENDETVADAPKSEEAPAAGTENEAPKPAETPAAGTENEAPKPAETPAAGTENEAPKPAETPATGTGMEAPKPAETPAAGTGMEAPKPEETPAAGTENEAPKTEETTAAAEIETTAAVKTDMDIALENERKALLKETRAADLVDGSVASARVLQYTLDDLSKSFWSAVITDRYEVNVFAEDTAFTEAVELELKELAKPEEAEDGSLAVGEDTLTKKQVEALKADGVYENSQSLDIRFVNAAGEEVEPSSAVKVRIKVYKEALPEDADISTMAIRHLDEKSADAVNVDTVAEYREDATSDHGTIKPVDGDGKVTELQTVDAENADEETAAIAETAAESKKILPEEAVAVESTFTVNRFSSFTITFGTNNSESATVKFVRIKDGKYEEITTNAVNLSTISANSDSTKELDLSKYAADYVKDDRKKDEYKKQNYTFSHVELLHGGKTDTIDNKLKVITDSTRGKMWQWQHTTTPTTEESEEKNVTTGLIENTDTIYVVYTDRVQLTTVKTVDNIAKGFHLYMTDYTNAAFDGGGYGSGSTQGTTKLGLYSRTTKGDYPTLTSKAGREGESIQQWFQTTNEVNHLFIQSVYDETGYFYYNSAENFATLKNDSGNTTNTFKVYNQLGTPSAGSSENFYYYQRGNFMPYNRLNKGDIRNRNRYDDQGTKLSTSDPRYNEALYGFIEGTNYYFGMYGWAEFYQPVGGQVNGEDMIFEFTGDDDMVVYIDGVLVLDLGGIHDAQSGYINFATGVVGYTNQKTGATVNWNHTDIYQQFYNARSLVKTSWKTGTNTFADGSKHKIQFFYMERGAGASNLKIKVNIPPIPDGSVNIQKLVEGLDATQAAKENYTLQLRMKAKNASDFTVAANQKYTLTSTGSKPYHTDENGKFTIHGTDTANFAGIAQGTEIEVTEPDHGRIYKVSYTAYDSNKKEIKGDVEVPSAGYVDVKVTNNAQDNPKSLTIVKKFKVNDQDANTAPDANDADKFEDATFTLLQKGENETEYEILYKDIKYSSFTGTAGSKSYTFEDLDPTKTYKVIENITSETDGGSSTTPYTGTDYAIGDITETTSWTTGTTSGEISLQTEQEDGTYHYYNNKVTFVNKYQTPPVNVEFTKVDAEHTDTGLEGAKFALYTDENATTAYEKNGEAVTATSGKDGKVTFTELPYRSTYYMKEIQAPSGYVLDNSTIYTISITVNGTEVTTRILKADGSEISDLKIKNTAIETELTFYKKSKTKNGTEISLDGAVFEIKRLEGSGYKTVTDIIDVDSTKSQFTIPAKGIKLTKIKDGTYQIREITAPAGYNLLTEPISFVIENGLLKQSETASEVVTLDPANKTVTIYNTAGIELPETGGMGTLMTTMSGMALMLIALGYLILVKRREKGGLN
ncbi:MAG: SpaA isopeptide-forming pilin-related protein [Oribacterium sp.]|nr:SpaA isopeptide-forming pilin-related protein [Oribacterium sp.]